MGKQGGDLKWWGSTSSTVLLDPAAFVESWKRQIQGKDGIPAEHQRLVFAYRVATQEGLSYTCKRSSRFPRTKERAGTDFLRELRGWKALLKSNNHVIAKLLRPLVAAEDEEIASHLYCETAGELRDIGIPCNVYYLFFDKWLLAAPLEGNKCCKISSNINIQIDKDFQSKTFEILLFGRLNGNNLPVPFVYRMNGGEVAAQMSMHDQTAKYRQRHQMRHLGLSTQSVEKGVEGRDFNACAESGRSLNGCHGSEHHDNQIIRCGKGLELTAIVTKDHPRQFKYIVLAVIQVPPVGAPKRLEPTTPHIPAVQAVSEWGRGGEGGLEPDSNGSSLSSCITTVQHCDMYPNDKHKIVEESLPVTSSHLVEHLRVSTSDNEDNVSITSRAQTPSQGASAEHSIGEGNAADMDTELTEPRVDSLPIVDEPAGKNAKKKKKRKGRRSNRRTAEGSSVASKDLEYTSALAGICSQASACPSVDKQTVVAEGVSVALSHGISGTSREQRPSSDISEVSQLLDGATGTDRKECVSGRQGESGQGRIHLSPSRHRGDGFDLGNVLEAAEELDALSVKCLSLGGASKQAGRSYRNEPMGSVDMLLNATGVEEEQCAHADHVPWTGKDLWCPACPNTGYRISGDFRDPCSLNASPDHRYMSTSSDLLERLNISQPSEHVIDVIDFVSLDGVLQDLSIPDDVVCNTEGPQCPLRELTGNPESFGDKREQFNEADTKTSARGGYSSGGSGSRSGRGGAEGSSNRGHGRGTEERSGTGGYPGGGGQGSGGSGQGTGPGSSGTSGGGGGGGGGAGGGNGNRGGGGGSRGGDWDGRPAENDGGNGSKEGDSDERHGHSFQAGSSSEITSESLQRKKAASPLDSRNAKKVTIGAGEHLANGTSSNHATSSGGGKENSHTFWQKVQKSTEAEEVAQLEHLRESFGSHKNHLRTGSDEVNTNNRADSKSRALLPQMNGIVSHERTQLEKKENEKELRKNEKELSLDSSEQAMLTQGSSTTIAKSRSNEWLLDHAELPTSGSRRVRDITASSGAHGPETSKGAWQKKISWDEQRQNSHRILSGEPEHAGPSKAQLTVKQTNVRFARNGTYTRGQMSDQQTISHTRSYSAPSTPHVFEEPFSESGELNHYKSAKHMQGATHQTAGPSSVGQIEQLTSQISLRPYSSHSSSVSQVGEVRQGSDELPQRFTSWKGSKPTGEQDRSVPREKIVGDRERTAHSAQKWVPVEHRSGAVVKGSNAQVKAPTSVSVASPATTSGRDIKENHGESAGCKQSVISDEVCVKADGVPCNVSPSKSFRRLQTILGGARTSCPAEYGLEPRETAVASEGHFVHAEQANLRCLLPREKTADTPAASVTGSEVGGQHITVAQKSEFPESSVLGERKCTARKDTGHRDVSGSVIAEPSAVKAETRSSVREVLEAVYVSCRARQASEKIAGMLGSPLAEFEKVLAAVAPSFDLAVDPYCRRKCVVEEGYPCVSGFEGVPGTEGCISGTHEDFSKDSRCRYSNTPISSLWQWYEEPSYYGVEVRSVDSHRGLRDGGEQEQFLAYFVPYLSGLQLFGYSSHAGSVSKYTDTNGCTGRDLKPDSFPSCHPRTFQGNDVLAKLFPVPGRAEEMMHHQRAEGSLSELANVLCNDTSVKDTQNLDARLLFEFFDADQPQVRQPLYPKVKDLSKSVSSSNSHYIGDPAVLEDFCLGDLHPASWFAVAWYPIYRIPEGPLRAVFLTYHSFHHMTPSKSSSYPIGGGCEGMNENHISLPVVGLECYNLQAEPWLSLRSQFTEEAQSTEKLDIGSLAECLNDRIRSLKKVAELMAKGIPYDVVSRSTESSSGGSVSKFKHCDYEFFLKRRR